MIGIKSAEFFLLLWGSLTDLGMGRYFDAASACLAAREHTLAVVLRIDRLPSTMSYTNICYTPGCNTPPDTITVTQVKCRLVPESKVQVEKVEPEHWVIE